MKSLDVVVLCKLFILEKNNIKWSYKSLSEGIFLSASETHASVKRLVQSGIYSETARSVTKSAMLELLITAVKYVFPAEKRSVVRGMPTAHSAPVLKNQINFDSKDTYVWPHAKGNIQGISIAPLSKTTPSAAEKDNELYELLALIDTLRIGKAREKNLAEKRIKEMLQVD